ncbi:hypothetical protein ZWY2020_040826 [Hordeum vulgare]|nr:hypothetical protein ZWY2020_040826 [Hordeum vulgare]
MKLHDTVMTTSKDASTTNSEADNADVTRKCRDEKLVRKTHKGEFQVEIEEPDGISVEVELWGYCFICVHQKLLKVKTKTNDETSMDDKTGVVKDKGSDGMSQMRMLGQNPRNFQSSRYSLHKRTVSESDVPALQGKSESKSESPKQKPESPKQKIGSEFVPDVPHNGELINFWKVESKEPAAPSANTLNPVSTMDHKNTAVPMIREYMGGSDSADLSSLTNVVAIFKGFGEKPSGKEWSSLIEIKGRVKLSAFQEFVEQLPKSRSRAIMVTELCWKEGSPESGRQHFSQTIDSYIADERVGLAEPADGLELYLCPPQGKTVEILSQHLPKEHLGGLAVAETSIIGIVVWRDPVFLGCPPSAQNSHGGPPGFPSQRHHQHQEEDVTDDDVPQGLGLVLLPAGADDLPEFNFVNPAANVTLHAFKGQRRVAPTSARPVEQMRELVQKYGKRSSVESRPWADDDDDDIPEWNPTQQSRQQRQQPFTPTPQQPLPPPPPLPTMQQVHHAYQQYNPNAMQPLLPQVAMQYSLSSQQQQLPLVQQQQQQLQPSQTWQQQQPSTWWPATAQQGGAAAVAGVPAVPAPQYGGVMMPNGSSAQAGNLGGAPWGPR